MPSGDTRAMRHLLKVLVVTSLAATAFSTLTAATASARGYLYQVPAGAPSPQYVHGTCIYRIWYGNYGSIAFAKFRAYSGDCGGVTVSAYVHYGDPWGPVNWGLPGTWTVGSDSCGSYYERQATSDPKRPAYGVGMGFEFPGTNGDDLLFRPDWGTDGTPPIHRRC